MSDVGRCDTPSADWGEDLARAQHGLERVRAVHAAATDARAVAVWRARRAGASLGYLGKLLGMARNNVLALERRGAELVDRPSAGEAVPELVVVHDEVPPLKVPDAIPPVRLGVTEPEPAVWPCMREGCTGQAEMGRRLCPAHLYN